MIRLLICDDSDSFRFVVRSTLAEQPGITVVGEASDGREAVDLALALSPDVILMDVRMPVLDGVEATRAVRSALPDVRVVALTGSDDRQIVSAMLEAGASAYCVKGSPLSELERAVTGLPNRRAFEERLDRLLADPAGDPFGLVLLELDCFERVNEVAREVRGDGEAYRLHEDQLAVLVPGGGGRAQVVAARLLGALGRPLPSASAGVAAFPLDGMTPDRLLATADFRLFAAKAEGGGRIVGVELPNPSRPAQEVTPTSAASERHSPWVPDARGLALPRRGPSPGKPQRLGPLPPARVLVVDDDERLRNLLRTTLEVIDIEIDEAPSVPGARARIDARRPDVVVLDLRLPGPNGLTLCEELKRDPRTRDIGVIVLTGSDSGSDEEAKAAGADAYLRKPFSPLDLLAVVEQLAGGLYEGPFHFPESRKPEEQLIRYAEDLRRLLELEQGQRTLIQAAYRETVGALTSALEAKDLGTNAHSHRVQHYAMELAWAVEPRLVEEPSIEYGFLLHDVGKIGIPDRILNKPAALTHAERRVLETHPVLGEQMLGGVALLQGGGLRVVRHHHERWDGEGYPDRLRGYDIPLPARIFAAADALDAMTSDRPYRPAMRWEEALGELHAESGRQFDPRIVDVLAEQEHRLRSIHEQFAAAERD